MSKRVVILIAQVRSDSNKDLTYNIERHGTPKAQGGKGIRWSCDCPQGTYRPESPCKHLKRIWHGDHKNVITLSPEAKQILR